MILRQDEWFQALLDHAVSIFGRTQMARFDRRLGDLTFFRCLRPVGKFSKTIGRHSESTKTEYVQIWHMTRLVSRNVPYFTVDGVSDHKLVLTTSRG